VEDAIRTIRGTSERTSVCGDIYECAGDCAYEQAEEYLRVCDLSRTW